MLRKLKWRKLLRIRNLGSVNTTIRATVHRFILPEQICKGQLEDQNCSLRHPRICKWLKSKNLCQRESDCDYLHDTLACKELDKIDDRGVKEIYEYPCQGCKTSWTNKNHVKVHLIGDSKIFFCLNCDGWIQNKSEVL